jgi:hypothetical protein
VRCIDLTDPLWAFVSTSTAEVNTNNVRVAKNLSTEDNIGNTPRTVDEHHCMDLNGHLHGPVGSYVKR